MRRMKVAVAIPRLVLVVALAACGTACGGGGGGSVGAPMRLPTGVNYVWAPTQSGMFPINVVSHTVGRPLRGRILEDFHNQDLALAPGGHTAYIATLAGCFTVNLTTGAVSNPIAHTKQWQSITMARDGRTFYLSGNPGKDSDDVLPVHTVTHSVGAPIRIPGGRGVIGMEIAPDGNTAYVVTESPFGTIPEMGYITTLNLTTHALGTPIPVTGGVDALAIAPDGQKAYAISATLSGPAIACNLFPIDLVSSVVEQPVLLGFEPHAILISSNGRAAYLTDGYGVRFIDLATGKLTLTIHMPDAGDIFAAPL